MAMEPSRHFASDALGAHTHNHPMMMAHTSDAMSPETKKLIAALYAELLGSLFLVFFAVGITANENQNGTDTSTGSISPGWNLAVAFGVGTAYAALTELFSRLSGAHFNPAITISAVVSRRISPVLGMMYVAAQIVGGICGSLITKGIAGGGNYGDLGKMRINSNFNTGEIFGLELLCTTFVVLFWSAQADPRRYPYGQPRNQGGSSVIIGATYFVGTLLSFRWDMAGMNPIRAFGPAVVTGDYKHQWVFWVGPIMGGLLGMLVHEFMIFLIPHPGHEPRLVGKVDPMHRA